LSVSTEHSGRWTQYLTKPQLPFWNLHISKVTGNGENSIPGDPRQYQAIQRRGD
jgi:hypothetical protein